MLDLLAPTVLAVGAVSSLVAAGCAPDTDLFDEPRGDTSGAAAVALASGVLVEPPAGAADVPPNLAAIVVRFEADVVLPADALQLAEDLAGTTVPLDAPVDTPCGVARCLRCSLLAPLAPNASYRVGLGPGALDAQGQAMPAGLIGVFDTAAAADDTPPALLDLVIEPSGPCLRARFGTDEAADGAVVIRGEATSVEYPAGMGLTSFDVALPLPEVAPGTALQISVRVQDRAGNMIESPGPVVIAPAPLPRLAITEVLANAAGAEPAQEYIELRNLGAEPVLLDGLRLEDARGADVLPAASLDSGAYALVVPSSFVAGGADVAPRSGTLLVAVDTRLGGDGLTNSGEAVTLRSADGQVISSFFGAIDVSASKWAGSSVHRLAEGACDHPSSWSRTPLPATPGWAAPL